MKSGIKNRVITFNRQTVLKNMLDFGRGRADAKTHLTAGGFIADGGFVGQAGRSTGHQTMPGLGDSGAGGLGQNLPLVHAVAFGGARYAYLVLAHGYRSSAYSNSKAGCGPLILSLRMRFMTDSSNVSSRCVLLSYLSR